MNQESFKEVLGRYIEGNTSPLENAYVEKWYEAVQEKKSEEFPTDMEEIGEAIYLKIKNRIEPGELPGRRVFSMRMWLRVAAVLLILAGGAVVYYLQQNASPVTTNQVADTIVPGSEKAVLKLADGSEILLDSTGFGNLAFDGGAQITKLEDGTLAYKNIEGSLPEIHYNEMQIPAGGSHKLRLPDGTMVWLNSVSSIKFPTRFTGNERKVFVKGEAYFEVAHDKTKPFIVEVQGKQRIAVLGTHFNVSAYDDESEVTTTLLEGTVKVNTAAGNASVTLQPGQQSVVKAAANIETRHNVDIEQVMAWKNGYFVFNHTEISQIMRQVSRWYNARIELDPRLRGLTFTGKIQRKEDVQQLLKIFETTNTVDYSVKGDKIKIFGKK